MFLFNFVYDVFLFLCLYILIVHCATSRTVWGSIPGGVTGDFSVDTDGTMCPGTDSASKNE